MFGFLLRSSGLLPKIERVKPSFTSNKNKDFACRHRFNPRETQVPIRRKQQFTLSKSCSAEIM